MRVDHKIAVAATAGGILGMGTFKFMLMLGSSEPEAVVITVITCLVFGLVIAMTRVP